MTLVETSRRSKRFAHAVCRTCTAKLDLGGADLEAALEAVARAGWEDRARRGVGMVAWDRLCPACIPPRLPRLIEGREALYREEQRRTRG